MQFCDAADCKSALQCGLWAKQIQSEHLRKTMTKTERLLRELISLPSVNPAFLPARDPNAGEQRIAECLAAVAARAGLEVEFEAVLPGRSNLFARLSPSGKARRRILLAPHLDTV